MMLAISQTHRFASSEKRTFGRHGLREGDSSGCMNCMYSERQLRTPRQKRPWGCSGYNRCSLCRPRAYHLTEDTNANHVIIRMHS